MMNPNKRLYLLISFVSLSRSVFSQQPGTLLCRMRPSSEAKSANRNNSGAVFPYSIQVVLKTTDTVSFGYVPFREGNETARLIGEDSDISKKAVLTYNSSFDKVATTRSAEGLTTSYTYDVFGRLKTTTLPEGYAVTRTLAWESSNGRYSVLESRPGGGSNVKTYYDLLGHKVRSEVSGFNDASLVSTKTYNERQQLVSETAPRYGLEQAITTTYQYDDYGRLTNTSNGTASIAYAYQKLSGGQYKITTTNGAGQSTSKTKDPTGRVISATDNGGSIAYTYDSQGNQTQVSVNGTTAITSVYDVYGSQTSLTDRNAGTVTYQNDAFGQLTSQTDALGHTTTNTYDLFGRVLTRVGTEGTTTYEYWKDEANGYCNDALAKVTGFSGDVREYTYNSLRRLTQEKITVDGTAYTTQYVYDTYGNLAQTTYPTGAVITRVYDHNGIETQVKNGSTELFNATAMNSLGRYTAYTTGNGKSTTESYDLATGRPIQFLTAGVQNLTFAFDAQTGNLTQRKDVLKNLQEDFTYDNLYRLVTTKVNNVQQMALTYDGNGSSSLGNIVSKTDAGNYTYNSSKVNAVAYITNPAGATSPPTTISTTQQDINYTAFLKTAQVSDNGYVLNYTYGSDYQRIKSVLKQSGTVVETRLYLGGYEKQVKGTVTNNIIYVAFGNGLGAVIVNGAVNYVYKDHLGSILTVTNSAGIIVASQNFDAWGRNRNPDDWTYANVPSVPDWLYRGYTGHEHLKEFALINMNGRMYDPVQGRMMSPDNYVMPNGTQGYNRYTYAGNNPLKYTDPDGNFFWIPFAAAGVMSLIDGFKHGFDAGWIGRTMMGQVSAGFGVGVGMGVGAAFGNSLSGLGFVGNGIVQGAVGGVVTGGVNAAMTGQNVWNGALNGGAIGSVMGGISGVVERAQLGFHDQVGNPSDVNYVSNAYKNNADLYDALDDVDIDIGDIKSQLHTKYTLASENNLPPGYTFDDYAKTMYRDGTPIDAVTSVQEGWLTASKITIRISPSVGGTYSNGVPIAQSTFGHELLHAYHIANHFYMGSVSESATSQYSYEYGLRYGYSASRMSGYYSKFVGQYIPYFYNWTNLKRTGFMNLGL
ncbi:MAG: RHS repeat-associated core domain-containing protein [Chitinophagaceae bacterium]